MANKQFEKLLEPGYIGPVKTRNRMVKTGAGVMMWHESETTMNGKVMAYYESLARGGIGLLIVESPTIDYPSGARWRARYRIDDDKFVPGLSALPKMIHSYGCPTFMQMNHDGPWQAPLFEDPDPAFLGPPIAASPVSLKAENDFHNQVPHALTIPEIEVIIEKFVSAAVRAQKAGFDGVDINAASSHLLHNFLSPFWNRRQDIYGGSAENRARFVISIVKEIKRRLGNDFPVSVCINASEFGLMAGIPNEKCITIDDAKATAKLLEAAGVNMLHIRSHWLGYHVGAYLPDLLFYPEPPIPDKSFPDVYNIKEKGKAWNVNLAGQIKEAVKIPVMVVAKLDAGLGEKTLREGKADFIAMTRRLQADPDYPNKVIAGQMKDIVPCMACENCLGSQRCRVNAFMGKEYNTAGQADKKKKVLVIGAGPAGLEAARVAALRGHDVTLYDKQTKLGGLLGIAALVKGTELEPLPELVNYYRRQLKNLGVEIKLGKEVTLETVDKIKPDAVIVAVGGKQVTPDIKGIQNANVVSNAALHKQLKSYLRFIPPLMLRWLTNFYLPIGKRVVIIGGALQGCELGEFFTLRGRQVIIIDKAERLGQNMVDVIQAYLFGWFRRKNVELISGLKDIEITPRGVMIMTDAGERKALPADTVVTALPLAPDLSLYESLKGKAPEVYAVGDCKDPLLIADAISAGMQAARGI